MSSDEKDPIVEQIREAREAKRASADAAAGEHQLVVDFQQQADKSGKEELAKIEALFAARCKTINEAGAEPEFQYDNHSHSLKAGNFALTLEFTEGYSPYFFHMISGLCLDATPVFLDFEPEYEATQWKFLAPMDDGGFFWECNDNRYSNEQIVEEGLSALAKNLGGQ